MRYPGFIGPSYQGKSKDVDNQRTVNMYLELNPLGTGKEREPACLVPTPGLTKRLTLPLSPTRGAFTANGTLYMVAYNKLYSISSAWVATEVGTLLTTSGPVSFAENGTQMVLVDGTYGYSVTLADDTFAQITDPDFQPAKTVTYQDGYFIFEETGTGRFFITGLNSVNFDSTDIATAEAKPDNVVAVISAFQQTYVFGESTLEVYYNSGNVDFPFERIQGAVSGIGCSAPYSVKEVGDTILWIGGDSLGTGIVYMMDGYKPVRVSTTTVETVIRENSATLSNTTAWAYQSEGHHFYCLNIPGVDVTWCYDLKNRLWHERTYKDLWGEIRHRAETATLAYGKTVVGDFENGNVYTLDQDVYTDNGTAIIRTRQGTQISGGLKRLFHSSFQLDMEVGVGLDGGVEGSDPYAALQWSNDGGRTWSNEQIRSIGKIGEFEKRVIWRRLGSARNRIYRVMVSAPVKVVLIGAELEVRGGQAVA